MSTAVNPGSPGAVAEGCVCPVIDNHHGKGSRGDGTRFIIVPECPMHGGEFFSSDYIDDPTDFGAYLEHTIAADPELSVLVTEAEAELEATDEICRKIDSLSDRAKRWLRHAAMAIGENERYINHAESRAECRNLGLIKQKPFGYIEIPSAVMELVDVNGYLRNY